MTTGKQNIGLGVGASLGLHGLAVILLLIYLSGNTVVSRGSGQVDLFWVSLSARQNILPAFAGREQALTIPHPVNPIRMATEVEAVKHVPVEPGPVVLQAEKTGGEQALTSPGPGVAYARTGAGNSLTGSARSLSESGTGPAFVNAYPRYRENPPPDYPLIAKQRGYEGVVFIQAEILMDGRVGKTRIGKSSGYAILDQTAIRAVRNWKFEPAKKSGIPCKSWAELPIKFVINGDHSSS